MWNTWPHVVLNIKVKKNSNGDIINLSGNPNKLVNNYSLKIPELVPNIMEQFEESPAKKEENATRLTCPVQYPYAFGSTEWGTGTDCCIGNPGKKEPMNLVFTFNLIINLEESTLVFLGLNSD